MRGALFLTPEKGRKRAPPQGATKITCFRCTFSGGKKYQRWEGRLCPGPGAHNHYLYSPFSGARKRAKKSAAPGSHKNHFQAGNEFICTFSGGKKYQKAPGPGPHKKHFQAGNFITRAGFAPSSNNKISSPLERRFIDGAKGPVKRQRQPHKRKRLSF